MTKSKGYKYRKRVFLLFGILISGWLLVNWFFTYRLESYLNKRLAENISHATDGFYSFSFGKLSIGFFNGELSIENIILNPDSSVYQSWLEIDSIPSTYYKVRIDRIDFKGINLTWRFDYKELEFKSFDVRKPSVELFESNHSGRHVLHKKEESEAKDIYEIVSPFFDMISVEELDLKDASVSYTVEDSIKPAVYALTNMNFSAHGFLLDKDSKDRGKLLYSENFDFWVEHPQTILDNGQLLLKADTIRLNTKDSIVQIKGVSLEPPIEHWKQIHQIADEFVSAKLKRVELRGVNFSHDGTLNHIKASSFEMDSSDVRYFHIHKKNKKLPKKEITVESLSLYKSISPIFASVSIDNVLINNAQLEYVQQENNLKDVFTLKRLNVHAQDFLIDSLSNARDSHKFLYSNRFELIADEVEGRLARHNHNLKVNEIALSSFGNFFRIHGIKIEPITKNTNKDYLEGNIGTIAFEGFFFTKGMEIEELNISNADMQYSPQLYSHKRRIRGENENNVLDIFSPFLEHLLIGQINLKNANLSLDDKESKNFYELKNVQARLTDFLINADTRVQSPFVFGYNSFDFNFTDFGSTLSGGDYHLSVGKGNFIDKQDLFQLENVSLKPNADILKRKDNIQLQAHLLEIVGARYNKNNKEVSITSVDFRNPVIQLVRQKSRNEQQQTHGNKNMKLLQSLVVDRFKTNDLSIKYEDKLLRDTLALRLNNLELSSIRVDNRGGLSVDNTFVSRPIIVHSKYLKCEGDRIDIGNLQINETSWGFDRLGIINWHSKIKLDNTKIYLITPSFTLSGLQWQRQHQSAFNLAEAVIKTPSVSVHHSEKEGTQKSGDIFVSLGKLAERINLEKLSVDSANLSTNVVKKGKEYKNELKAVNFGLEGVAVNTKKKEWNVVDLSFQTRDINYSISDFYTLVIDQIDFSKKRNKLIIDNIRLESTYPKSEFAYVHPTSHDWFNVVVGKVQLSGIDFDRYIRTKYIYIDDLLADDIFLDNLKNQKVEIEHNKMPLLYEELHKLPIRFAINNAEARNFNVVYEELPKDVDVAAKLTFMNMNGKFRGLTNIVTDPEQFIELKATGKLMNTGDFRATWKMPVSPENDLFMLDAEVGNFNMTELNSLVMPMAPAKIESGLIKKLSFSTEATSYGASVNMTFLYNDLNFTLYKNKDFASKQKFYTYVANRVLKKNNPDRKGKKPRVANADIIRDPYHSTFNYFWQILQPPLIESVGVSKSKQNFIARMATSFEKIKRFFRPKKPTVSEGQILQK